VELLTAATISSKSNSLKHRAKKKLAIQTVERPTRGRKAGKAKAKFITRAVARQRAERHVIKRMFKGAMVRDGVDAEGNACHVRREDTGVVFKNLPGTDLRASEIIVVCKRTGQVPYEGSAGAEG
jgi:hypothetical protein